MSINNLNEEGLLIKWRDENDPVAFDRLFGIARTRALDKYAIALFRQDNNPCYGDPAELIHNAYLSLRKTMDRRHKAKHNHGHIDAAIENSYKNVEHFISVARKRLKAAHVDLIRRNRIGPGKSPLRKVDFERASLGDKKARDKIRDVLFDNLCEWLEPVAGPLVNEEPPEPFRSAIRKVCAEVSFSGKTTLKKLIDATLPKVYDLLPKDQFQSLKEREQEACLKQAIEGNRDAQEKIRGLFSLELAYRLDLALRFHHDVLPCSHKMAHEIEAIANRLNWADIEWPCRVADLVVHAYPDLIHLFEIARERETRTQAYVDIDEVADELFARALLDQVYFRELVDGFASYLRRTDKQASTIFRVFCYFCAQYSVKEMAFHLGLDERNTDLLRRKARTRFGKYLSAQKAKRRRHR